MASQYRRLELVVIAGPSGSGKTHLMRQLVSSHSSTYGILDVWVTRSSGRTGAPEPGRVEVGSENYDRLAAVDYFSVEHHYDGARYGSRIPKWFEQDQNRILWDYPGEYPACAELHEYNWCGILVLPPSREELERRLRSTDRATRTFSALQEYQECEIDLVTGLFVPDRWLVHVSDLSSSSETVHRWLTKRFCDAEGVHG